MTSAEVQNRQLLDSRKIVEDARIKHGQISFCGEKMTKLLISVVLSMIKYGEYQTSFWPVMKTSEKNLVCHTNLFLDSCDVILRYVTSSFFV